MSALPADGGEINSSEIYTNISDADGEPLIEALRALVNQHRGDSAPKQQATWDSRFTDIVIAASQFDVAKLKALQVSIYLLKVL